MDEFGCDYECRNKQQYINNKGVFTNAGRTHISRHYIEAQTQNGNTGLQYADRISQSRDTGKTRDFISSLTRQSKTEIHRELESYNKEREHL